MTLWDISSECIWSFWPKTKKCPHCRSPEAQAKKCQQLLDALNIDVLIVNHVVCLKIDLLICPVGRQQTFNLLISDGQLSHIPSLTWTPALNSRGGWNWLWRSPMNLLQLLSLTSMSSHTFFSHRYFKDFLNIWCHMTSYSSYLHMVCLYFLFEYFRLSLQTPTE